MVSNGKVKVIHYFTGSWRTHRTYYGHRHIHGDGDPETNRGDGPDVTNSTLISSSYRLYSRRKSVTPLARIKYTRTFSPDWPSLMPLRLKTSSTILGPDDVVHHLRKPESRQVHLWPVNSFPLFTTVWHWKFWVKLR